VETLLREVGVHGGGGLGIPEFPLLGGEYRLGMSKRNWRGKIHQEGDYPKLPVVEIGERNRNCGVGNDDVKLETLRTSLHCLGDITKQ